MRPIIWRTTGLILLAFAIGFLREFFFENINTQLYFTRQGDPNPHLPNILSPIANVSYNVLYTAKYPLMLVFIALNFWVAKETLRGLFPALPTKRWTLWTFGVLLGLSIFVFLLGFPFGDIHRSYAIARQMIEPIQSPMALFILMVGCYVQRTFAT